ncbi:hypothetical protein M885DRAFT_504189 [Pelagophyceae sp. CCMP2097]|nr:hypothetical protein M885DRAFT_504189 [Pelagophyceae sp. CCMP2097]
MRRLWLLLAVLFSRHQAAHPAGKKITKLGTGKRPTEDGARTVRTVQGAGDDGDANAGDDGDTSAGDDGEAGDGSGEASDGQGDGSGGAGDGYGGGPGGGSGDPGGGSGDPDGWGDALFKAAANATGAANATSADVADATSADVADVMRFLDAMANRSRGKPQQSLYGKIISALPLAYYISRAIFSVVQVSSDGSLAGAWLRGQQEESFYELFNSALPMDEKAGAAAAETVGWGDVVGADDAVRELRRVMNTLSSPAAAANARRSGARAPHNVLLTGPPGTGKTWLSKAAAFECGAPLLVVSAAEIVKGKYAGVGVERVKSLFNKARSEAAASEGKLAMVFIDELDSCGRSRGGDESSASQDRDGTLNQILVELDGFKTDAAARVIVVAATNRPNLLDAALMRKGRFDVVVPMRVPGNAERAALFAYYIGKQRTAAACDEMEFDVGFSTVEKPGLPSLGAQPRRPAGRVVARVVDKGAARVVDRGSSNGTAVERTVATWRLVVVWPQCGGAKGQRHFEARVNVTAGTLDVNRSDALKMACLDDKAAAAAEAAAAAAKKSMPALRMPYNVTHFGVAPAAGEPTVSDLAEELAQLTPGAVGADVSAAVNDAALEAAACLTFCDANLVPAFVATRLQYFAAVERLVLGAPLDRKPDDATRLRFAYHEAGHALASFRLPAVDASIRVSVSSRAGGSGGATHFSGDDVDFLTRSQLHDRLVLLLAGRAAELLFYGEDSTGAADDLQKAQQLAKSVITEFGLSALGAAGVGAAGDRVDDELRRLLDEASNRAAALVAAEKDEVANVANALYRNSTLDRAGLIAILGPPTTGSKKAPQLPEPRAA